MIGPQKGLSTHTLWIEQSTCEVITFPRSPVQGLQLKTRLDFDENLNSPVRTKRNFEFAVDTWKSIGIHRNFIIFRCACNTRTITTRKIYFQ